MDEVFVNIDGVQHYLRRAIDQDGEVVDVFLQKRRDGVAAKRFFMRLLARCADMPQKIIRAKLGGYRAAQLELMTEAVGITPNMRTAVLACRTNRPQAVSVG